MQYLLDSKGKGDYRRGDEIIVRGRAISTIQTSSASKEDPVSLEKVSAVDVEDSVTRLSVYGSGGFDPGFHSLVGDGAVDRTALGFDELAGSVTGAGSSAEIVSWSAFQVPAGAAQPTHLFEATYTPTSGGNRSIEMQPTLACAADCWLLAAPLTGL